MRAAPSLILLALATLAPAREHLVRVPFVGCPADGQTGYIPPPKSGKSPSLPPRLARQLAYYGYDNGLALLAPRGWHCVGLYGSSGSSLIITPERHKADEFFSDRPADVRGPAIQVSVSSGGTSGRDEVARGIARYFPTYRSFVRKVIKMDREIGYSIEPLSYRPDASDVIRHWTPTSIEFTTPARRKGEGTRSRLLPGNLPISGLVGVDGPVEEPDLLAIQVRLPAKLRYLTPIILSDGEADAGK